LQLISWLQNVSHINAVHVIPTVVCCIKISWFILAVQCWSITQPNINVKVNRSLI